MVKQELIALNRAAWDVRTQIHQDSAFYDVAGFLSGNSSLQEIELALLGDVSGKRFLHLQCHFGLDTLSLARMGAVVTGVDFSSQAIAKARELADQANLEAQFICADVLDCLDQLSPPYDQVYASYGAICWLPHLDQWAQTIRSVLRPGGRVLLVEFHPVVDWLMGYDYFHSDQPCVESETTYTENAGDVQTEVAVWSHTLGDVVNALIGAGMRIRLLQEYPFSPYDCFKDLTQDSPGRFVWKDQNRCAPLVYAIEASRDG